MAEEAANLLTQTCTTTAFAVDTCLNHGKGKSKAAAQMKRVAPLHHWPERCCNAGRLQFLDAADAATCRPATEREPVKLIGWLVGEMSTGTFIDKKTGSTDRGIPSLTVCLPEQVNIIA